MTHVNYFVVRFRLSEISFVLKAIATLVVSMKKAPASKGKIYTTYIRLCRIENTCFVSHSQQAGLGSVDWPVSIPGGLHHNNVAGSVKITTRSTAPVHGLAAGATILLSGHLKRQCNTIEWTRVKVCLDTDRDQVHIQTGDSCAMFFLVV